MSNIDFSIGQFIQAPAKRSNQKMHQNADEAMGRMGSDIEHIKRDISDIRTDLKEFRGDLKDIRKDMRDDFRIIFKTMGWAAGIIGALMIALLATMAKGFGWL